jgi:hypothetical protein
MRKGAFELAEPVPELNEPHALMIIPSWLNAGGSAGMTLSSLEKYFEASQLAKLARPGEFFDFTRYLPMLSIKEEAEEVVLTNATITYSRSELGCDFIFIRLPEPHSMAEAYIESVVELLEAFGVKRYGLLGSVYGMVPYTRPLLVTGTASNRNLQNRLSDAKVVESDYEGPTTILYLVKQHMLQLGIETFSSVVHLPNYQTPENDYRGENRLMDVIGSLYGLFALPEVVEKAKEQEEQVSQAAELYLQQFPQLRLILKQLEDQYDARIKGQKEEIRLSPEDQEFLQELNRRFEQS